jgi:glycosyltransferase A (GT-A) superfamily protein (DUF2064 family)
VIGRLAAAPFWETIIAVSPDTGVASRALPGRVRKMPQGGGDLGHRMQRPMRRLPPGPVCVIGTDIPGILPADVRRAFRSLGAADMAFGPATDGGFWLVGARRRPRVIEPYRGVAWSSAETLAQVQANLRHARIGETTTHTDVDERADYLREKASFGRRIRPLAPHRPS